MSWMTRVGAMGVVCLFGAGCWPALGIMDAAGVDPVDSAVQVGVNANHEKACNDAKAFAKAHCDRGARCASNDAYFFWSWSGEQCEHWVAAWYTGLFTLSGADDRVKECQKQLEAPGCDPTPACADLNRQKRREKGVECSSTSDCKVGFACISGACSDRLGDGAKCNDSDQCQNGLSCQKGVCHAVSDGATACHDSDECHVTRDSDGNTLFWGYSRGADRFYCDDATLKCRAVQRDRPKGEKCGEGRICASGLYCKGWILNGEGTCQPTIKYGDRCDDAEGCLSCSNNVCKDPLDGVCN